jgi:penicillin-binding protein-related factor A (putative recombinase)
MADTPEKKVKKKVTDILKSVGAYYFYPVTGGFGMSGVPDIICCYKGRFIAIECKAGKNKTTPLQEQNITRIKENHGIAIVVNEDSLREVYDALASAEANAPRG